MKIKETNLDEIRALILSRCSNDLLALGEEDVDWLFSGVETITYCHSQGKDLKAICEKLDKSELQKAGKALIVVSYAKSCRPTVGEIGELANVVNAFNPSCSVRFGVGSSAEDESEVSIFVVSTY